ncbi:RNA polymerase sigma-70 factor [Streptomyces sp. YC504]|uniref:RNA polymerase sigma-70 factor n=1 Tax=Streptomyces mesophilus TaxID=1775132 RepID=A0A6G4XG24_9ACTN|nr:RNA polymerase sigma-70 factor [Streptomyces mesophilus]NGO76495.1 RNA polymerase sigma-70 factor [Streptomyces mesophilus]
MPDDRATDEPFLEHRRLLFATAYRMLGSVADAEDVLQDTWLSWSKTDRSDVGNARAYLVRTVTNLCLNRLASARATRETYVGPWLPEPLLTTPDVAEEAEMAESVSMAMLVVLETLGPVERAVFVLREVFGYSHAEIAEVLGRSEQSVRQTAHRARSHVQARRPRYEADGAERERATRLFLEAASGGDLNGMMALLAPDVTCWSDGGGKVTAARRPLHGADAVARWVLGVLAKPDYAAMTVTPTVINGDLGLLFGMDGATIGTLSYEVSSDGLLHDLRFQVNPDKLGGVQQPGALGNQPGTLGDQPGALGN